MIARVPLRPRIVGGAQQIGENMALKFSDPSWNPSKPSAGQTPLSYSQYDGNLSVWDSMTMGGQGLDMGRAVTAGNFNPAANGVNTTQLDGQSSFVDSLAGFGQALLQGIGVRPDQPQQMQAQPVGFWGQPEPKGLQIEQIAIFGLIGAGLYFAFK